MKFRSFGILLLIVFGLAATSYAQVNERDKADAAERAREFIRQFRRSQDLKPLLPKFFTADFMNGIERDSGHNSLVILSMSDKQKIKLTDRQRQRYYIATINTAFLASIYNSWKMPDESDDDNSNQYERPFPPGVKAFLERTRFLRLILHDDEFNEDMTEAQIEAVLPKTSAEALALTVSFEKLCDLYRRSMVPFRHMSDKAFETILAKHDKSSDVYHIKMASCNDRGDCPGVPKGTPLIGVHTPLFDFIDFARLGGRLRIVRLLLSDESMK